jgi:hypothetical protein
MKEIYSCGYEPTVSALDILTSNDLVFGSREVQDNWQTENYNKAVIS